MSFHGVDQRATLLGANTPGDTVGPGDTSVPRDCVHKSTPDGRLDSLTGLRWFAALLIFLYHFAKEDKTFGTPKQVALLKHYLFGGPTAVSFFFVLSGFVLAWTLRSGDSKVAFWRRRWARIYPSHLATFFVALALLPTLERTFTWPATITNVTLTQSWIPNDPGVWFNFNGVSWSLSCEFFFYAMFPFLARGLTGVSARTWWILGGLSALFVVVLPFTVGFASNTLHLQTLYVVYTLPVSRLPEFILGICLAFLVKAGKWRGPGLLISLALCAAALFWMMYRVPKEFHYAAVTVIPYALLIAAAASADVRGKWSFFRLRSIVYLGEISFCFYLTHELVILMTNHVLGNRHIGLFANFVPVFCVALVSAVVLHEFVEKPGVRLLSRAREKRRMHAARPTGPGERRRFA